MSIFHRKKKVDHTELRLEKVWNVYEAKEVYRLREYHFDKKMRLLKGSDGYTDRDFGDAKWARLTANHFGLKIIDSSSEYV